MLLVNTNVPVDVLQNDPQWADWSIAQLRAQAQLHALAINPVIYAELSLSFSTLETLFLAGKAYLQHRRRGGGKAQVLPDFFIGAHAAVEGWHLLTRDASRFRTYFPSLEVVAR